MARSQRILKLLILLYMPFGILAGLGAISSFSLRELSDAHLSQQSDAPDKTYRAYVERVFTSRSCGRNSSSMVVIERRFGYLKTGEFVPFCVDGSPDEIHLSWSSSHDLVIACQHCDPSKIEEFEGNWGTLRLHYDLPLASDVR